MAQGSNINKLNSNTFVQAKRLFSFLRKSKVNILLIPVSVFFSFCYSQATLYAIALLFPLTQGIIGNNFNHVRRLRGINNIVHFFPGVFNTSGRLFILLVVIIYAVTLLKNVFLYFSGLTAQIQAKKATRALRQLLLEKCLGFSKEFYDKNTLSYLQGVLTKSTDVIQSRFMLFQSFFTHGLLFASYLFFMVKISWMLTLITVVTFPFINWMTRQIIARVRLASEKKDKASKNFAERVFNMLYCMPVIQSFGKEAQETRVFLELSQKELKESFKTQKLSGLVAPVEDIGTMTQLLIIAFAIAGARHFDGSLTASNVFVFFYLIMRFVPSFNSMTRMKLGLATSMNALDDVEKILNKSDSFIITSGTEEFPGLKNTIQFKDLSFRYSGIGPSILNNVSFSVDKGSIVAIVGPSGSGKSTLMHLLLRFYDVLPQTILIDGKDIRDYDAISLRRHMAFVTQDVLLFNNTIRNNIVYGAQTQVSDESLTSLMQKIHIHDFIEAMPEKYETPVGERGGRLSGGERQRLALARSMIKDTDILIMDEATSALDSSTEAQITEAIGTIAQGKTIIIIAHRLSTIKKADKIIFLSKGKVEEAGSVQELVHQEGLFYKQLQSQRF